MTPCKKIRIAVLLAAAAGLTMPVTDVANAMPTGFAHPSHADSAIILVAKKKSKRQKEVDRSVEQGTVPARYRSSIPKQYHQYIPFEKGR